ncbi:hypothetical protein BDN70DRAFT_579411 [Pholiota conissans]|uniref:Uncharacterized protein n=1 Tax=Pholiota conissans TaxID=109636 RepID=A0A9P5Z561_9AGAR|nr:hypothetical protein BDN70DRAFT_579411 [Pholiota conissans]
MHLCLQISRDFIQERTYLIAYRLPNCSFYTHREERVARTLNVPYHPSTPSKHPQILGTRPRTNLFWGAFPSAALIRCIKLGTRSFFFLPFLFPSIPPSFFKRPLGSITIFPSSSSLFLFQFVVVLTFLVFNSLLVFILRLARRRCRVLLRFMLKLDL